jgi:V/A-type H+-transporting ATPase subunit K
MVDPYGLVGMGAAIGAGLAVGLAGLGTGFAEKDVGAAAVGATAEQPSMFGKGMVFMVIPETVILFGFLIAIMLIGKV